MITLFGEGRGFRVAWLLEEMGLPYRLRPVDLLAGLENDAEFLAINPAGFIPAIQDGETIMVEIDRDHGISDGAIRPDPACPGRARPRLPRLSSSSFISARPVSPRP